MQAAECTKDNYDQMACKKCLDLAIDDLLENNYRKIGGGVYYESCYIRFELYFFLRCNKVNSIPLNSVWILFS